MKEPPPTLGVGAIVLRGDSLLMVQRGREPAKGLWSVPGGKVERGEYLSAARKNVRSERKPGCLSSPAN